MNFKIEQINNGTFKISALIKRNGKQFRKRETFTGAKRSAERRGFEMVLELEGKAAADQQSGTGSFTLFKECAQFYTEQKQPTRGNDTYINRLSNELGSFQIDEIPEAFERFMNLLLRAKTERGKPYSTGSRNRFRSWISAILNYSVECGKIEKSPFKRPLKKEREVPRDRSLTSEEIERLFEAIEQYRPYLKPLVQFLLQIPCRKSELLNARRVDLDLKAGILRIRSGTTKNGNGINKPIPLNMMEYFRSIPSSCPWVFYREVNGEYRKLNSIDEAWHFCLEKANIKDFRIHDTRHYSATELVNRGIAERQVMEVAGWQSSMLSIYYHRTGTATVQAVQAVLS